MRGRTFLPRGDVGRGADAHSRHGRRLAKQRVYCGLRDAFRPRVAVWPRVATGPVSCRVGRVRRLRPLPGAGPQRGRARGRREHGVSFAGGGDLLAQLSHRARALADHCSNTSQRLLYLGACGMRNSSQCILAQEFCVVEKQA